MNHTEYMRGYYWKNRKKINEQCKRRRDANPLKTIWEGIKARCLRKTCAAYPNYGGRGIRICDEWLVFENFKKWAIESGYDHKLSIDRINNDGDYSPQNCRWADRKQQAQNRRTNSFYTSPDGERKCITDWARIFHVGTGPLARYIKRNGWEMAYRHYALGEKILHNTGKLLSSPDGITKRCIDWANYFGVNLGTLCASISRYGWAKTYNRYNARLTVSP